MRFAGAASPPVSFREALFAGLAPDGSLYRPVERPDLSRLLAGFGPGTGYPDLAARVSAALLAPEVDDPARAQDRASAPSPSRPRCAASTTAGCCSSCSTAPPARSRISARSSSPRPWKPSCEAAGERIQVLVATSGDTGSAVAHAFHGRSGIDVVILYPSGRVSMLQERQLTTLGGNVHALEVTGSFDDCQRLAKEAFRDPELRRRLRLTSANSINIGRLLPQAFSYVWAAAQLQRAPRPRLLRAERQLRPPDRGGVRVALGPPGGPVHRRDQRERRGARVPRHRQLRPPPLAAPPCPTRWTSATRATSSGSPWRSRALPTAMAATIHGSR